MHYLKHLKDSASDWYVVSVSDLIKIFNHHKNMLQKNVIGFIPKKKFVTYTKNYEN